MTDTKDFLRGLMGRYTIDGAAFPEHFEVTIRSFFEMDDWKMEGYSSPEHQRQKSIKFEWGHNHDFGAFKLDGVLGDRHIDIITTFIDDFGLPKNLEGKQVLDVGVWCGGTSLLLAAMGAKVVGVEEVHKYARCADFLGRSFSLPLTIVPKSLYLAELGQRQFDYIIFPGVLYHLTDPILALRILFNALKDGGGLFIETAAEPTNHGELNIMRYSGSMGGANSWFIPSRDALQHMLLDVGFPRETIEVEPVTSNNRMFGHAQRTQWRDMLRAGLSRPNIK